MRLFSSPSMLFALFSLAIIGCGEVATECDDTADCSNEELETDPDPVPSTPVEEEPTPTPEDPEEEPEEPQPYVGQWAGVELVKSFNGNVFFDYPAVDDEMELVMTISEDLTVDYFLDIPSSDTAMTGAATAGATPDDLSLDLEGEVTYNSGRTAGNIGTFTCTVDVDTLTCTGTNDEEGDLLPADMVFERM